MFDLIDRVAPTSVGVLILGESGTGKEIVAQTIHEVSNRSHGAFVAINCGAVPESLIESELFGHERGSFTGADRQHKGIFERADGGTLFLDEITEMPMQLQVKLLRVLETGLFHRVGGSTPMHSDVRVLAATNRNPEEAIQQGKLREDLYFRLAVFPIFLPRLNDRDGDITLLARHFLSDLNATHGTEKCWETGALEALETREWKGNVRELKNAVHRAYILADEELCADDACIMQRPMVTALGSALAIQVGSSIADVERELIQATVEHTRGDKVAAAKILGISIKTIYVRLSLYKAIHSGALHSNGTAADVQHSRAPFRRRSRSLAT